MREQKPKSAGEPLFYEGLQPQIGKLTQAQQARRDQIELAGHAKLASLSARLEAVRPKPKPEPEEPAQGVVRHALPAIVPPQPPPATWGDLLTVMNEKHAIIDNVGGKTVIASWEPSSLDPTRRRWVFQNKESFLLRYSNRYATIEITTKRGGTVQTPVPLSGWWLTHRHRQQYRGITFQPDAPKVVNECLNLWQDWGCKAKEGDWSLIRDHIETVLASGNPEFADYLMPGALVRANPPKPNTAYTRSLIDDAILRVPRLRWDLSDIGLRNFLTDEESIGVVCTKYRSASANGWSFPPLSECREAWSKRYGPTKWDSDMIDWGEPVEEAEQPRAKPAVVGKSEPKSEPANVNVKPIAPRAYRRY